MPRTAGPRATTYVALLRGINVSGKNKVAMADLRDIFTELGLRDVVTYIQSGNVVFTTEQASSNLPARIEAQISKRLSLSVPVVVRAHSELASLEARNPFLDAAIDGTHLPVIFLAGAPNAANIARLDPARSPGDRFAVSGGEIFLHCPNGSGRSKLTIDYFERLLETRGTARNWNTVIKLRDMTTG